MQNKTNNFFIITGGPGSGKTSIINELKNRGYYCVDEGARQIIKEEMKINDDALPWKNLHKYQDLLLEYKIASYNKALKENKLTFFDCGILELMAYNKIRHNENPNELLNAINSMHFNNKVFVTPPWKEIFCQDSERVETYDQAVEAYYEIIKVYKEHNYNLIEVPKLPITARADFIINNL